MLKYLQNILFFLSIVLALYACKSIAYKGPMKSANDIRSEKDQYNYNARQANEIIDHNVKTKKKRQRKEEKNRRQQQKELEDLNSSSRNKRLKRPVPADFY